MFRSIFGGGSGEDSGDTGLPGGELSPEAVAAVPGSASQVAMKGLASPAGFDPTGLERAAKAARELDSSKHAKEGLALVREQEKTKQADARSKAAELEAYAKQMELEKVQKQGEEQRATLAKQAEQNGQLEVYKDKLERKRNEDNLKQQIEAQRFMQEENRRKEEESVARVEAARKKTLEYEADLRQGTEIAKVRAEAEGRIAQERANHDLHLDQSRVSAGEYRKTVLESIKTLGATVGEGTRDLLADPKRLGAGVAALSALAVGVYGARAATGVAGRYIEARLGKPSLVRETSRIAPSTVFRHPLASTRAQYARITASRDSAGAAGNVMSGIVLSESLEERLRRIAMATVNAKRNHAPYRNVLLYGPPGTGKTLFAKALARHSGLEYAIMTGGDVAPLGREAVTELHKLFDWANSSRRGLLLFIDEADAFLRSRSGAHEMSEDLRSALNAFLYRTGESSDRFLVVYASNEPELFDRAANDRIDDVLEFDLPGEPERLRLLNLYFDRYVRDIHKTSKARQIMVSGVTEDDLIYAAALTDGFSGREISKLAIGWQAAAFGSTNSTIDSSVFRDVLDTHQKQKLVKRMWATPVTTIGPSQGANHVGLAAAL